MGLLVRTPTYSNKNDTFLKFWASRIFKAPNRGKTFLFANFPKDTSYTGRVVDVVENSGSNFRNPKNSARMTGSLIWSVVWKWSEWRRRIGLEMEVFFLGVGNKTRGMYSKKKQRLRICCGAFSIPWCAWLVILDWGVSRGMKGIYFEVMPTPDQYTQSSTWLEDPKSSKKSWVNVHWKHLPQRALGIYMKGSWKGRWRVTHFCINW